MLMPRHTKLLFLLGIAILLFACNGGKMPQQTVIFPSIKDVPDSAWEQLSNKTIYFGHHSVGANIIDGIKDLMAEHPKMKLNIVETDNSSEFERPLFAHSRVGKNRDTKSKIDGFVSVMDKGLGTKADIAFFKFCYVDFTTQTNVNKVFAEYKTSMSILNNKYPDVQFVHFTAPLESTSISHNLKIWLKNFLGASWKWKKWWLKKFWGFILNQKDNITRNDFNELIREEYEGKELIFDLAKIESTYPDGRVEVFTENKKTYFSLLPLYTDDGGHLNERGRKKVAEQLLILLANIANNQL